MTNVELQNRCKKIKLLALDFDGVMTDGRVLVSQDGSESVFCSRKDGLGIELLQKVGIKIVVISKETNSVVAVRCKKLNIPCWQSVETGDGKKEILERVIAESGFDSSEVAYMGDDVNDIPALQLAGLAIVVADGHSLAKQHADHITAARGGDHAVREVCDILLENR